VFRKTRALVILAIAVAFIMTVMTPLAMACDTGGSSGGKPGDKGGRGYNTGDKGSKDEGTKCNDKGSKDEGTKCGENDGNDDRDHDECDHVCDNKKVLIFGSDPVFCNGNAAALNKFGIKNDVVMTGPLTAVDLNKYYTIIFDPEYYGYGQTTAAAGAPTGISGAQGWYGGLSPEESAYLEGFVKSGQIGLVYQEPYFHLLTTWPPEPAYMPYFTSTYCQYGQIPFLQIDFKGQWVIDPITMQFTKSPITKGVGNPLTIGSCWQWDSIGLVPGQPNISKEKVFATTAAGNEGETFRYGKGRVVLTGIDTYNGINGATPSLSSPDWARLVANAAQWAGRR
jgi:hypothetical protein